MNMPEEFTVPQAASYLNVSEETVRRNIRSKRLSALRRGTQWFIPHDVLLVFANSYDPKTGQIQQGGPWVAGLLWGMSALNARRACVCENLLTTLSK